MNDELERELRTRIKDLEEWIRFYQEKETKLAWVRYSDEAPQRNLEMWEQRQKEKLPKIW
jgi:hypothetical protein